MPADLALPGDYATLLDDLKGRIRAAQTRATLAVNAELVGLYWTIGRAILARQVEAGWGSRVVARLADDLRAAFPEMKGFSPRNLLYMRAFAEAYPDEDFVLRVVAQLPWGHNQTLLNKLDDPALRRWYAEACIAHGWTRPVLDAQISTRLHLRQGAAQTNFDRTLPSPTSELAQNLLKDPYTFDFLSLGPEASERDLENGLLAHLERFMLELGAGFAFVGRQKHLEVGGQDYYLDLLFYHLQLRCFVVVELKVEAFKPEFAGKLNFYLSAVDDLLRHPADGPTIGLLLCREKNRVVVEYALRDVAKPLGVAEYDLAAVLPAELEGRLPSVEQLEAELMPPANVNAVYEE